MDPENLDEEALVDPENPDKESPAQISDARIFVETRKRDPNREYKVPIEGVKKKIVSKKLRLVIWLALFCIYTTLLITKPMNLSQYYSAHLYFLFFLFFRLGKHWLL